MVKTDSEPVTEKELKEDSEIEEIIEKDGNGYGDLNSVNIRPDETNIDSETYIGRPASKQSETYIQERKSYSMGRTDQNKLSNTRIGDTISYYDNGVSGSGIVTKMSGQFIEVFKTDGKFYNININDTFHVADILVDKTWDEMSFEEKTDELLKVKAYSPRFLNKTWQDLPRELRETMKLNKERKYTLPRDPIGEGLGSKNSYIMDSKPKKLSDAKRDEEQGAMNDYFHDDITNFNHRLANHRGRINELMSPKDSHTFEKDQEIFGEDYKAHEGMSGTSRLKSNMENSIHGNVGSNPSSGISTNISFDADEEYEGDSHEDKKEEFKYENKKPEVSKEPKAPEAKLDEQGLVKTHAGFVYSDNPSVYKIPPKEVQKGYGIKYGVKYINDEDGN